MPQFNSFVAWKLHFSANLLFVEKNSAQLYFQELLWVCAVILEEGNEGGVKWIGDTICYKIYPMIHGLFYKRWIKTDLDYYKWHWSKILECSGPTDEEDKQHAFQKHRNLHRLVQEGTPWNSIYCFLICSLNSLSFMTFISNPTNYINQYSLTRPAQRAVWRRGWRCALCGRSIESPVHKVKLVDVSVKKECVM